MSGPVANNIFRASGVVAAAGGGLNWNSTILTALTTFTVTVQNVSGNKYFIDGVQQQTLNLLEGFTYKFDQADSSNSGHPLRFSTTSGGTHSGGSEYTTGVTTSGTPGSAGAYTQIVVASGAPLLYYYCTNHNYMGGTANTVDETVEANKGYWIDTTSTTCTITLPSSPSKGDQIILVDYARTWGTNKITIDSNGSNYQGDPDTFTVEYSTNGEVLNIIYSDATKGWIPQDDDEVADAPFIPTTYKGILGFGSLQSGSATGITNLISSSGVVASDTSAVGAARIQVQAANYGGDKAIFMGGYNGGTNNGVSNLVNNSGVVASDVTGVADGTTGTTGVNFGTGLAGFFYGDVGGKTNKKSLVNSSGVVASTVNGVGTARDSPGAAQYSPGYALAVYYGGRTSSNQFTTFTNLISNTGVQSSDVSGVGTGKSFQSGAAYGGDKGIMAFGFLNDANTTNINLVSNVGVIASDTSGTGTARRAGTGTQYGADKGIFLCGYSSSALGVSNLVSNTGVVASDTSAVATARYYPAAAGYSLSA